MAKAFNDRVTSVFNELLAAFPPGGAMQVVVHHRGRKAVDLAGSARYTDKIDENTPFLTFSVSKVFTGLAVHHLVEKKVLDLDAPVMRYWPEFGQKGKESATLRHVLLHQAGVPAPHLQAQVLRWPWWSAVTRMLAGEEALYPPGTKTSYHLVNYGFILGEVVRRVTGMPVDEYLRVHFFQPMGLANTFMRLPAGQLKRTPRLVTRTPAMRTATALFNLPFIRTALLPAAGLHSSARELAVFFQMLLDDGVRNGSRYLRPQTVRYAARSHNDSYDEAIRTHMNWGLGFIMGGGSHPDPDPRRRMLGWGGSSGTFAGMGMGTCMVWADRREELVTALTCNVMADDNGLLERWGGISNAVWDSLAG